MSIIISNDLSLPRDIDVSVSVSKPQAETTTDLSVMVFATTNATFDPDANRIKYYSSLTAVAADFVASSEVYKAATAFFAHSPRAKQMAVGRIFDSATAGYLKMGSVEATVATWKLVSDGSFTVSLDGVSTDVTAIDFSSVADLDDVAAAIQAKLHVAVAGTTCVNTDGVFKIISATTGIPRRASLRCAWDWRSDKAPRWLAKTAGRYPRRAS
jgi:hypothetical protein